MAGALSRAQEKQQQKERPKGSTDTDPGTDTVTASGKEAALLSDGSSTEANTTLVHVGTTDYARLYSQSQLWAQQKAEADQLAQGDPEQRVEVNLADYQIPSHYLLWLVVSRGFLSSWRDSKTNFGRFTTLTFLGCIFGLIFLQIDDTDYAGVNSKLAAIFSAIGFGGYMQNQLALPNVIAERAVYYRERASDSYSSWMYSLTLGLVEVPYIAIGMLFFTVPFYFMVGFNYNAPDFFKFYLSVFMLSIVLSSFGQWSGATFPTFIAAMQSSGMLVTFWFLFGGVHDQRGHIPARASQLPLKAKAAHCMNIHVTPSSLHRHPLSSVSPSIERTERQSELTAPHAPLSRRSLPALHRTGRRRP